MTNLSKQKIKNRADRENSAMADKPRKFPRTHSEFFTWKKLQELCQKIEEDIFYCQKKSSGLQQNVTRLLDGLVKILYSESYTVIGDFCPKPFGLLYLVLILKKVVQ